MQEIFKSHRSIKFLLHLVLHNTHQRKNSFLLKWIPFSKQMKNGVDPQDGSMWNHQRYHYMLLIHKLHLLSNTCLGRFKNSYLSIHSICPYPKMNGEVFLAIENYRKWNSVAFHYDNTFIKRWGALTIFFKEKPPVIHPMCRYSYIHAQCERNVLKMSYL